MAADLPAQADTRPGWVRVQCHSATMADWLTRAIVMENVAARSSGVMLYLPAAPHFRIEKEIKNVVTVIAKTAHYWMGHMSRSQKTLIADLFTTMSRESPLIEPAIDGWAKWRGCRVRERGAAVWMMRALVAFNVVARREQVTLFVPINEEQDPGRHDRRRRGCARAATGGVARRAGVKAILIHGNGGCTAGDIWLPWLERELTALGLDVINQTFPDNIKARAQYLAAAPRSARCR